jgi:hypothetical protein
MEPRIRHAIGHGFRTANRSWGGMGVFAGGVLAIMLVAVLCLAVSDPPPEVFQEPLAAETMAPPEAPDAEEALAGALDEEAAAGEGIEQPSAEPESDERQPTLFDQLETVEPSPRPAAAAAVTVEEQERAAQEWFGRAWPLLLLALLVVMVGNVWLSGGQIGYVANQVTVQRATIREFWSAARRSFLPLLAAATILLAALGALAVVVAALSLLLDGLPEGVQTVLGILLAFGLSAGLLWLVIRISFWFIAIVADEKELLAGLRASMEVTRGRWWRVAGLALLLFLISYGAGLPGDLLVWLGVSIGGGAEPWLGALGGLLKALFGLYVGFAAMGAYVRFYEDAKAATAGGLR